MPFFVKRNGQAVPIVSEPNVINDTTASQSTAYSGSKVDSLIANKIDALTPKVYSLFIAKTDWDETGTVEIDVPGTFGYDIPSENYNQLVLSDEQTDHWRRFNVCLDHAHDASGYITTIEFSCDPGNIPDRPIYFNIVSSKSEYVDWSVIGNLIVPPGLQVDTSFDSDSTNPVQNKVITAALGNKADTSALDNYVEKEVGKGLSTNDYTDADKALVQDSPITVSATGSDLTLSTAAGNINAITVYGKSEVVDGSIKSAGEGWSTVDLDTLTFILRSTDNPNYNTFITTINNIDAFVSNSQPPNLMCGKFKSVAWNADWQPFIMSMLSKNATSVVFTTPKTVTTVEQFQALISDVILAYQSTQGNTIAVKTDNGTGINGTMAVFETGTPLCGVSDTARDIMQWGGSAGTVTKKCGSVDLGDLTWEYNSSTLLFFTSLLDAPLIQSMYGLQCLCSKYENTYGGSWSGWNNFPDNHISCGCNYSTLTHLNLVVKDTNYNDPTTFKTAVTGVKLVYPLATPTTEQLTTTENDSIAGLRTFQPQTHAQNNAGATMTVEAYAGTANGQAVQELESRIKSEIDEVKNERSHFCYSYKIDMSDSNPATCVKPHFDTRYGCDNFNFTSAHMDYANDRFDYGSWEGFIRRIARPCMLKYDGTVDYYLDPDDYSKKITGEASDVADVNYQGNAMVELEKLYFKRYTHNGIQYCFIADRKLDKSFKAYAHHDKYGKELDYIYRACYDGMYDGTRLRSISGIDYHNLNALTAGYIMSNATRQEEMNFAKANNVSTEKGEGWNILHKSEWDYINDILVLIGMSTDTQGTFGRGRDGGYVSTSDTGIISTGTMDTKGLFWGKNDSTAGVKVLGIENHWANLFKSCAGWMLISNQHYTKMTFGTEDGSTGTGFNTDGTGYLATGASISANGYISDWAENDNGFLPTAASGSASTYRCDYVWQNTATYFALVGGRSSLGLACGAFCADLSSGAGFRSWDVGAALSYKPLSAA